MTVIVPAARCDTRVDVQPPQLTPQYLRVAIVVGEGYKPRSKNIFVIKIIIARYCHWRIVLKCVLCI